MRIATFLITLGLSSMLALPALAQTPRPGTIIEMSPIENRGDDETQAVQTRRRVGESVGATAASMGTILGMHKSKSTGVAMAVGASGATIPVLGRKVGGDVAARIGSQGEITRYMVKVKLDTGRMLSITQLRTDLGGLEIGSRVLVHGQGSAAKVTPAD